MNKTATIILAAAVLVGVTAAAVIAAMRRDDEEQEQESPQSWFRNIAKVLDRDINNVERRTSQRYHDKNQEKYENLNWDEEQTRREDIARNGCPFPAG
jgi:outer membrane biogenesis lipoprotein LolB